MIFSMTEMWRRWLRSILGQPKEVGNIEFSKEDLLKSLPEEYTQNDTCEVGGNEKAAYILLGIKKNISYVLVETFFEETPPYLLKIDIFGEEPTEILALSEESEEIH